MTPSAPKLTLAAALVLLLAPPAAAGPLAPSLAVTAPPPAAPGGSDPAAAPATAGLTLAGCVAVAVADSGKVGEAKGKVAEWQARLDEARSVWYPKLSGVAVAAPLFRVKGTATDTKVENDWSQWGPYLRLEATLVQPVSTFGRAGAGENAARERLEVERNQVEVVRRAVALEVTRYYYLYLYAKALQPTLDSIRKTLDTAQAKAQEMYEAHTGGITIIDVLRLTYGSTELDKYRVQAEIGAGLALAALKHTMGLAEDAPLALAAETLPADDDAPLPPLEELERLALERRPEAAQLRHGRKAADEQARMEGKGDLPVLALVGQVKASWTPVREDQTNPYIYDPYNERTGGVGLALQFDVDPARSYARESGARSLGAQVDGLAKYAATGIPAEVRKARDEVVQARRLVALSQEGSSATRKWMIFASSAYSAGTGDTRDILEGVAAYAAARKGYFDALAALHMAKASLDLATGAPLPGAR